MAKHKYTQNHDESVSEFHKRITDEYGCERCDEYSNNGCGNWIVDGYTFEDDDSAYYDCDSEFGSGDLGCIKQELEENMGIEELMKQIAELKKENAVLKRDVRRAEANGFISDKAKRQRERFELCDRFLDEVIGNGVIDPSSMQLQPENMMGAMVMWAINNGVDIEGLKGDNAKHPWKGTTSRLTRTLGWKYGYRVGKSGNAFTKYAQGESVEQQ